MPPAGCTPMGFSSGMHHHRFVKVKYDTHSSKKLAGIETFSCLRRIPLEPFCLCDAAAVSCGIPQSPGNGSSHASQYTVGSQITYHCNHGFHLNPDVQMTAVCLEEGSWSNAAVVPRCQGKLMKQVNKKKKTSERMILHP